MNKTPFWLNEIVDVLNKKNKIIDGFTTREFAEAAGICVDTALVRLKIAFDADKIEFAGKRRVFAMDGSPRMIPIYRLKKK